MDRRNFVRLMGIGAAATAMGAVACRPSGSAESSSANGYSLSKDTAVSFSTTCDVLVVGSGIAGLSAAMTPSEQGLKVIVADKNTLLGGESYSSTGMVEVYGTEIQASAGVTGTVDDLWTARQQRIAEQYPDAETPATELLQAICTTGPSWIDQMAKVYNASFMDPSEYLDKGVADDVVVPKSGLQGLDDIMNPMRDQLTAQGVEFQTDLALQAFVVDGDGKLSGARFLSPESQTYTDIGAKCIVLATGSYTCNQKFVNDDLPQLLTVGSCTYLADGAALQLAQGLGAATLNMDLAPDLGGDVPPVDAWGCFAPVVAVSPLGRRFAREDVRYSCPNECFSQKLGYWWTVFDTQIEDGPQGNSAAKTVKAYPDSYVGPCNTVEDLADAMNVPADTLKATLEAYNKAAKAGKDDDFGRTSFLEPLEAPFHAIRQTPVRFRTVGGLRVNGSCQVLDSTGATIDNLYACGSCAAILSSGFLDNAASGMLAGSCAVDALQGSN